MLAFGVLHRNRLGDHTLASLEFRIAPDHLRRGFGTDLFNAAKSLAREMGCNRLVVDIPFGQAGAGFAQRHGGTLGYEHQRTVLDLGKVDAARYRELAHASGTASSSPLTSRSCPGPTTAPTT